jgi:hypothetical protein
MSMSSVFAVVVKLLLSVTVTATVAATPSMSVVITCPSPVTVKFATVF